MLEWKSHPVRTDERDPTEFSSYGKAVPREKDPRRSIPNDREWVHGAVAQQIKTAGTTPQGIHLGMLVPAELVFGPARPELSILGTRVASLGDPALNCSFCDLCHL